MQFAPWMRLMEGGPVSKPLARITVPWDVQRTSPNQRQHWRQRAKLTKLARDRARLAWAVAGRPQVPAEALPVRVSLIVRRARVIDEDNAISGSKALRDGLFNDALTPKDSQQFVKIGSVTFETGREWKGREECIFVVEALS